MGNKRINFFQLITNGVMTGSTTLQSATQNVENFDNLGLEFQWSGTPTGVISVWASASGINFFQVTDFDQAITQPAGSAGVWGSNLNQFPWNWFYIRYVNASGTGTFNAFYSGKDLN